MKDFLQKIFKKSMASGEEKSEGRMRLQRSSSTLRDYGVMKWRVTGGEVDSLFS